jgi:hypothetical protein
LNVTVALVGVYRARNARYVREVSRPALERGWTVAWWALDGLADELADVTVGTGAGAKFDLLNEILRTLDGSFDWLVVSDDDLVFTRGDVVSLQRCCERAGLDLAQPGRADAAVSHGITAARRLSRARRTSFVEIGPLFVVGPRWRDRIVPFPPGSGMGWGLELDWFGLAEEGCVLGIVDSLPVRHEGTAGEDYDAPAEFARLQQLFAARGVGTWADVQRTLDTWRPWQPWPRWASKLSP